ncbi:unnamed protein product [Dovyalis caffra]|uniref:Remorin C-terminal domain-containing protein n=1 Tax=Dovyalis caffra TaxID=77055 RepID=A0AAV1RLU2_9ROSI|nr:unnamed protein product [Dovyalis caffra]
MKQNLLSSQSLGAFPSPGGANHQDNNKGWSSERIPHPSSGSSRRHISALTPFYSGRALPSKWEDAERWICSPVLGYGVAKSSQCHPPRRAKSKSGPINVPPGNCSPSMGFLDGGIVRNFMLNSPFSTGVLMPDGVGVHYRGIGGGNGGQSHVKRLASAPGCSDLVNESSSSSSQDEKPEGVGDASNTVDRIISRRDMATQMSPESSTHSSCRRRSSSPPSIAPVLEPPSDHSSKLEIREVQVDKRATVIRWSKRPGSQRIKRRQPDVEDFNPNAADARSSSWDISEAVSDFSKLQREEAKITAWENLQKARAEAAIRKLEAGTPSYPEMPQDQALPQACSFEFLG